MVSRDLIVIGSVLSPVTVIKSTSNTLELLNECYFVQLCLVSL